MKCTKTHRRTQRRDIHIDRQIQRCRHTHRQIHKHRHRIRLHGEVRNTDTDIAYSPTRTQIHRLINDTNKQTDTQPDRQIYKTLKHIQQSSGSLNLWSADVCLMVLEQTLFFKDIKTKAGQFFQCWSPTEIQNL